MISVSEDFKTAMTAPVRKFVTEVFMQEDQNNLEALSHYTDEDRVKKWTIERIGDNSKFFGYTVCQKIKLDMVDMPSLVEPISKSSIKVNLGSVLKSGNIEYTSFPTFYLTERNRHEEEGYVSLTAYDKIYESANHLVGELGITAPYTIKQFAQACADFLDVELYLEGIAEDDFMFNLSYDSGANFGGSETLRDCLNAVAEATQTICFIGHDDRLRFRRLDVSGDPVLTITPEDYSEFGHSENRRLVSVEHVTELGDNVGIESKISGTTQYVRNNPFWENREDIGEIVEHATANAYMLTIAQFDCSYRSFSLLEIGDKIELEMLNGDVENSYVLDSAITYDGGCSERLQWDYQNTDSQVNTNPSTLSDALNYTYARVDKIAREIVLQANRIEANEEQLSTLQIDTEKIMGTVKDVENFMDETTGEIEKLTKEVATKVSAEDVKIMIESTLEDGVDKVTTSTGFTFNAEGLHIAKEGSDLDTTLSEDGMVIHRGSTAVLTVNNEGVKAEDLHATTYLIIGENSRFEDYYDKGPRTGCFWIGTATV